MLASAEQQRELRAARRRHVSALHVLHIQTHLTDTRRRTRARSYPLHINPATEAELTRIGIPGRIFSGDSSRAADGPSRLSRSGCRKGSRVCAQAQKRRSPSTERGASCVTTDDAPFSGGVVRSLHKDKNKERNNKLF